MNKTIEFFLNKFPTVPTSLVNPTTGTANTDFTIDLARLYHHYYTDCYGVAPPNPDHSNFEYLHFLSSTNDFRFLLDGPGSNTGKRRNVSMELGQSFCRYFLYEFCSVTYFAHMDKVLDKPAHKDFDGITIKRLAPGDAPDYLCAISPSESFIGEAKGRYDNISFDSKDFETWREQFSRVGVYDEKGILKKLKGYIIASKFVTDRNRPSNRSKILAEDPETAGEGFFNGDSTGLGRKCIAIHYSRILSKLGLNLLSNSLELGFVVSNQLTYNLPVWRCLFEPLNGQLFVGGYISESEPRMVDTGNKTLIFQPNILKLGNPNPFFFGLSVDSLQVIRQACYGEWNLLSQVPQLADTESRASNLAWLRDGSISGSLDFFEFVGTIPF